MTNEAEPKVEEIYAVFADKIDQGSFQRLTTTAVNARAKGVNHIHLLIQSAGGVPSDGIALFEFFANFPIRLTTYNMGCISSAAVLLYLAGSERAIIESGIFMIHKTTGPPVGVSSRQTTAFAEAIALDDVRTETIIKSRVSIPADKMLIHGYADLYIGAKDAIAYNLSTVLRPFQPPADSIAVSI